MINTSSEGKPQSKPVDKKPVPRPTGKPTSRSHKPSSAPRGGGMRRSGRPPMRRKTTEVKTAFVHKPTTSADTLRIVPLGGVEQVGKNCMFLEYGDDIMIIDMGLQFPEENTPGIDFIIPNVAYLKANKKKIRGAIITHGHYDHIGAIPYMSADLGAPPIYAMRFTKAIIEKRQGDYTHLPKLNMIEFKAEDKLKMGRFEIDFFHVNHTIFDTVGVAIKTPVGTVCHTADFKFDDYPVGDVPADYEKIKKIAERDVLLLMSDSTGAERPGHSISERDIEGNLEDIFKNSKGRIMVATFASLISRIQQLIDLAQKHGRKVAIDGYSMKSNVALATELGYLKIPKGIMVDVKHINDYKDHEVLFLCTGAQGEGGAVLMRVATREHRFIRLHEGDTVVFSSSVVPGNEQSVQKLKDVIYREGAEVFHYQMMDIHAGGHAQQEDLTKMIELMKPKFFAPIHGHYFMLKLHTKLALAAGIPQKNIVIPENGRVIGLKADSIVLTNEEVESNPVFIDGLGVGDVKEVVLRDRQMMAEDGMFVVIVLVDEKTGKVRGSPDIISRGFIYLKESGELLRETRFRIKKLTEDVTVKMHPLNVQYLREELREKIGQFLYKKTERRPVVLPVVIEV
ncbi:MAG: ribonuclease J [bacterium]|nr:ribonuclease J [bacterium]